MSDAKRRREPSAAPRVGSAADSRARWSQWMGHSCHAAGVRRRPGRGPDTLNASLFLAINRPNDLPGVVLSAHQFKTGFEQSTESSVADEYNKDRTFINFNMFQCFSGSDDSTDYSWTPDFLSLQEDPIKINNIVGFDNTNPTNYYMENHLTEVVGPHGETTRALAMNMLKSHVTTHIGDRNRVSPIPASRRPLWARRGLKRVLLHQP